MKIIRQTNPGGDNKHEITVPLFFFWCFPLKTFLKNIYKIIDRAQNKASPNSDLKNITDGQSLNIKTT